MIPFPILALASILVFNEDDTHMIHRYPAEKFVEYFDSVCRGAVTHFFMCPNAMRSNIDSKAFEPVWKALEEPGVEPRWAPDAKWLHDNGIDPYAIWIRRAREKGVSPWITMRMNDIHSPANPNYTSHCTLWKTHPEYRRDPNHRGADYPPYAFDYSHEVVRARALGYIAELLERYDVDGIETDWLRFPWHLTPGKERSQTGVLNGFMSDVRRLADAAAKRRGHPVLVGARVTTSYEAALELGTDPVAWAGERSIDWLVVCNFFLSADFNLDYADWERRIHAVNASVTIVPGLDSGIRKDGRHRQNLTLEEYRGWSEAQYAQGAPGLYLFNPFHFAPTSSVWNAFLDGGLSPSAVAAKPQAYPVGFRECAPARLADVQLPDNLADGGKVRIRIGRVPKDGTCGLLLAFDRRENAESVCREARLNGVKATGAEEVSASEWLDPKTSAAFSMRVRFPVSALVPSVNTVEFPAVQPAKLLLMACELEVNPKSNKEVP